MIGDRPNTYTFTKVRLYDRAGLTVAGACREPAGQREHRLARCRHEAEHRRCQLEGAQAWLGGQLQRSQRSLCRDRKGSAEDGLLHAGQRCRHGACRRVHQPALCHCLGNRQCWPWQANQGCSIVFCVQHNLSVQVYNCTSGSLNPITWGQVEALVPSSIEKAAFEGALWAPKISAKENPYVNKLHQLLFHYGPAHGVDLICRLVGRKPFLTK